MGDHDMCDERITKALATNHPGFAEFLAARCDLYHRRKALTPPHPVVGDQVEDQAAVAVEEAGHG